MTEPAASVHPEVLPHSTRVWGARLARILDDDFYLAGSAALALHIGHRPVHGLDLMSATHRLVPTERRDLLQAAVRIAPEVRVETARDGFLDLRFPDGVRVRLYYYPYPLAAPLHAFRLAPDEASIEVASLVDLGLMKLGAIISRGTKRDFVDLHLLCRHLPLADLMAASTDKFGHVLDFPLQAIKALADRSQWTGEPLPELTIDVDEEQLVIWLEEEIARFDAQEIGT